MGRSSCAGAGACAPHQSRGPKAGSRPMGGEGKSSNRFEGCSRLWTVPSSEHQVTSLATDPLDKGEDPKKAFRILIADDHEAVRRGLRSALSGAGWRICGEAVDGRDAIQKTIELRPDLLILDVSMPNVGGLEAAREILKTSKQTKILIFTMHESKQIRDETAAIGVHAMAVKSAPLSTLLATIDSLFRGNE